MVGGVLDRTTFALDHLPEGSGLRSVTAAPADIAGRQALRVELTDTVTFDGKPGVDYVDMPTLVIIPATSRPRPGHVPATSRPRPRTARSRSIS
jgi:hypothetical protein